MLSYTTVCPSAAGSERSSDILLPGLDRLFDPDLSLRRLAEAFSVRTLVVPQSQQVSRLRDLASQPTDKQALKVQLNSSWWGGKMTASGEVLDGSPSGPERAPAVRESQYRFMRFGLTGTEGSFRYGMAFRSAGQEAPGMRDRAVRELWGERHLGLLRLRSALSEDRNNVDRDPRRPRFVGTQERTTLAIAPRQWAELAVSYVWRTTGTAYEPFGMTPMRQQSDMLEARVSVE